MSLSEKEFVDKVFAIENKLSILELAVVDSFLIMLMCVIVSTVNSGFVYLVFIFGIASCLLASIGIELGYFAIKNFRKIYMPSYSYEELDFINRCEPRNPYASSNFVKFEHLFVDR